MSQVIYFAEDEPGRKWDKCVTDALLKTGSGAFIGYVYSLLFYSAKCRRRWPVVLGAAFGIGMAYGNCERALNNAILPQDKLLQQKKAGPFRIDVKIAEVCKRMSYEGDFSLFMRNARTKYTQDLAYSGNMTVPFYLNDTLGGPYRIVMKGAEKCDRSAYSSDFSVFFKDVRTKYNQGLLYSGNVTFPFVINDTLGARGTLASWSNVAGWRENAFVFNFKNRICSAVLYSMLKTVYENLMKNIFGEVVQCPYFAGFYRFENIMAADFHLHSVKEFIYGRWRVEANIMQRENALTCLRGVIDVVPV